jgi:hypothetical protein
MMPKHYFFWRVTFKKATHVFDQNQGENMEQSLNTNLSAKGSKAPQGPNESLNGNGSLMEKAGDLLTMNEDHLEGQATKAIEKQTSKIPSGVYLALAVGSMALSAAFATSSKRKDIANFVGLWAPSFLMLGLYNKIVKTVGSDSQTPA